MLELSEAQQVEAALTYHKTVLQAWHEVVNAIAAHRLEQARRARLRGQLDHTRAALDLSRSRYNDGVADFITVLDAERSLLQNEQQYARPARLTSLSISSRCSKRSAAAGSRAFPILRHRWSFRPGSDRDGGDAATESQ
jgi:hypothetical protein